MSNKPTIRVWVTKYAMTQGVHELDAEPIDDRMIKVGRITIYHKPDWHTSELDARDRVKEMIEAKIRSLRKAMAKAEQMKDQDWAYFRARKAHHSY